MECDMNAPLIRFEAVNSFTLSAISAASESKQHHPHSHPWEIAAGGAIGCVWVVGTVMSFAAPLTCE